MSLSAVLPTAGTVPEVSDRTGSLLAASLGVWAVGVQVAEPLAAVGMAGCAVVAIWSARGDLPARGLWLLRQWWPLWALLAWALLAPTLAGRPPTGNGAARLIDFVGVPLAGWAVARAGSTGGARVLGWAAAVLALSCGVAGLQHFGVWPTSETMRTFAFTRIPFDRVYEQVPGTTDRYMAGGLLFHRLKFSHTGGLVVLTLLSFGLVARGRRRAALLALAALGMGALLVFPFARAGAAALLLCAALVVVLSVARRRLALLAGAGLLLAGLAVVQIHAPLRERFVRAATAEGSGERMQLLSAGVTAVREHPVAGLGPGRFRSRDFAAADASAHIREHNGKAHNQLLSTAAETGVVGALLFLGLLLTVARRLRPTTPHGRAALGCLAFFALLSLFHDPLFHAPFSMALPLALGLGLSPQQVRPSTRA
jgi:O-antigen ligase